MLAALKLQKSCKNSTKIPYISSSRRQYPSFPSCPRGSRGQRFQVRTVRCTLWSYLYRHFLSEAAPRCIFDSQDFNTLGQHRPVIS